MIKSDSINLTIGLVPIVLKKFTVQSAFAQRSRAVTIPRKYPIKVPNDDTLRYNTQNLSTPNKIKVTRPNLKSGVP